MIRRLASVPNCDRRVPMTEAAFPPPDRGRQASLSGTPVTSTRRRGQLRTRAAAARLPSALPEHRSLRSCVACVVPPETGTHRPHTRDQARMPIPIPRRPRSPCPAMRALAQSRRRIIRPEPGSQLFRHYPRVQQSDPVAELASITSRLAALAPMVTATLLAAAGSEPVTRSDGTSQSRQLRTVLPYSSLQYAATVADTIPRAKPGRSSVPTDSA